MRARLFRMHLALILCFSRLATTGKEFGSTLFVFSSSFLSNVTDDLRPFIPLQLLVLLQLQMIENPFLSIVQRSQRPNCQALHQSQIFRPRSLLNDGETHESRARMRCRARHGRIPAQTCVFTNSSLTSRNCGEVQTAVNQLFSACTLQFYKLGCVSETRSGGFPVTVFHYDSTST